MNIHKVSNRVGGLKVRCVVALLACAPVGATKADAIDDPQLVIGRLVVTIGMSREAVEKAAVAKGHALGTVPSIPHTAVVWASAAVSESTANLGSIVFRDGKVWRVFKRWTSDASERGVDVGNAVFGAVSDFTRQGPAPCVLTTRTHDTPGQQEQTTAIRCGRRSLEITTIRNDEYRLASTSVTEALE